MNNPLRRITGIVLVVLAAISIVISIFFIVQVWQMKEPATQALTSTLELIDETMDTTYQAMDILQSTLNSGASSTAAIQSALEGLGKALDDSTPMIETIEVLFSEELPKTVRSTQTSLASAQGSAEIIDNVLQIVSAIPFVSSRYEPEVPLHVALGQISDDIDGLPSKFSELQQDLEKTRTNLTDIQEDIDQISTDIGDISQSLSEADEVIRRYKLHITDVRRGITNIIANIPGWMDIMAWILTFIFVWLVITQFGLLLQGWEMFRAE